MSNTPNIRFAGFTGAWKQRKCGDVLIERNIQHPKSDEFPLVSFTVENGVTPKTDRYEREQLVRGDKKEKKYKETRIDDIVYNPANLKFGAIARNKYGNAVFSPIYVTYEVKRDLALPSFIEMVVTRESFIQNALQYQQGTVYERMAVNTDDFATLDIMLPSKEEQTKIGEMLSDLDTLITLHQRKCDETKKLKKYMLKKMFPQNGALIPEIRFAGFTDAWEQRKLNSLMDFSNGFNGSSTLYGTGIPYISVMDILNNDFITYECIRGKVNIDEQTLKRFAVDYGDVLFQRSSENVEDAGSSNVYLGNKTAAFGGFVIRGKKKSEYDGFFIKNLLDSETVRKQITSKAQGAQHINVSQETLSDVIVSIPSIEEQVSIGKLFASINETITLHQRKCDELKDVKKYMLQNMFPQKG